MTYGLQDDFPNVGKTIPPPPHAFLFSLTAVSLDPYTPSIKTGETPETLERCTGVLTPISASQHFRNAHVSPVDWL